MSLKTVPALSLRARSCRSTSKCSGLTQLSMQRSEFWHIGVAGIREGGYPGRADGGQRSVHGHSLSPGRSWARGCRDILSYRGSPPSFPANPEVPPGSSTGQAMLGSSILHRSLTQILHNLLNHTAIQFVLELPDSASSLMVP